MAAALELEHVDAHGIVGRAAGFADDGLLVDGLGGLDEGGDEVGVLVLDELDDGGLGEALVGLELGHAGAVADGAGEHLEGLLGLEEGVAVLGGEGLEGGEGLVGCGFETLGLGGIAFADLVALQLDVGGDGLAAGCGLGIVGEGTFGLLTGDALDEDFLLAGCCHRDDGF